jgi:hypothetical protein
MSTQIQMDHFIGTLDALLDETFDNVHGYFLDKGTSMFETLATVSAEEASGAVRHVGRASKTRGVLSGRAGRGPADPAIPTAGLGQNLARDRRGNAGRMGGAQSVVAREL